MEANLHLAADEFIASLPHARRLGIILQKVGLGHAVLSMPYSAELIGDFSSRVIHGGAVSALLDTAAGAAVVLHPKAGFGATTLNLRIDYMRPAAPEQMLTAQAECFHVTRTIAFVRAETFDNDMQNPVATATGVFTVPQKDHAHV